MIAARRKISALHQSHQCLDMRDRRIRRDAVAKIEDVRPARELLQHVVHATLQRIAASDQQHRIEIALQCNHLADRSAHPARIRTGIEAALEDSSFGQGFDALISGVQKRVFLVHNIHAKAPVLVHSRFAMSYLRGPITRDEVQRLTAGSQAATPTPGATPQAAAPIGAAAPIPAPMPTPTPTPAPATGSSWPWLPPRPDGPTNEVVAVRGRHLYPGQVARTKSLALDPH